MFHYFDAVQDRQGNALVNYQVVVRDNGGVVPLYADDAGTPIASRSGIANTALANDRGMVDFFVPFGTFDIEVRTPDGVPSFGIASVPFTTGPGGLQGATGPADNTYTTLAALLASDPARKSARLVPDSGETEPAGNFAYIAGAWVRQTAEGVSFVQTAGARTRDTQSKVRDVGISPRDAPGFTDANVNQSSFVQWAIDKCLVNDPPAPLDVAGMFRIDTPLIVNRPVDQAKARFMLAGRGHQAGFRTVSGNNLFDSTLAYNTDPCSERLNFRDILFTADNASASGQTFTAGKFLRMQFDNCEWERMKCLGSAIYAQSWDFRACRARGWQGIFFEGAGAYAINAEFECKFGGGGMFRLVGPRGITQSSFTRGTYEALTGPMLTASGCAGVLVGSNYIEYNGAPGIKLDAGDPNTSFSLIGNIFVQGAAQLADPGFYDVIWGATRRGYSFGNTCNGRLHDTSGVTGVSNLVQLNDYAAIELYKGYKAGLMDQSRAAVGNVLSSDAGILAQAAGQTYAGVDGAGLIFGPGEVQSGAYVPIRQVYGTDNPQTNPGLYGNPLWTRGSVVRNQSATGEGQVREWVCTASGQPGTWRAQVMQ